MRISDLAMIVFRVRVSRSQNVISDAPSTLIERTEYLDVTQDF